MFEDLMSPLDASKCAWGIQHYHFALALMLWRTICLTESALALTFMKGCRSGVRAKRATEDLLDAVSLNILFWRLMHKTYGNLSLLKCILMMNVVFKVAANFSMLFQMGVQWNCFRCVIYSLLVSFCRVLETSSILQEATLHGWRAQMKKHNIVISQSMESCLAVLLVLQ